MRAFQNLSNPASALSFQRVPHPVSILGSAALATLRHTPRRVAVEGRWNWFGQTLLVLLVVLLTSGCGKEEKAQAKRQTEYADLPGLRLAHMPALRDELVRIEDEKATPAMLDKARQAYASRVEQPKSKSKLKDPRRGPSELVAIYPRTGSNEPSSVMKNAAELFPWQEFNFGRLRMQKINELVQVHMLEQKKYRTFLDRDLVDIGLRHREGFLADDSYIDSAIVGNRLEAFRAIVQLSKGQPNKAMGPLLYMFRMVNLMAREKSVNTRIAASQLRAEALQVVSAMVNHEKTDRNLVKNLQQLVKRQLSQWPSDSDSWIGDRALGMHTYELVRDGHFLALLDEEEVQKLKDADKLTMIKHNIAKYIDEDEMFYLEAMRELIACCELPFYRRLSTFDAINLRLSQNPETHYIAANVLLVDYRNGHRWQAEDRALCTAWSMVLDAVVAEQPIEKKAAPSDTTNVTARKPAQIRRNPTDGSPLEVIDNKTYFEVPHIWFGEKLIPVKARKHIDK